MRLIISFIGTCRWRCWLRSLGGKGWLLGEVGGFELNSILVIEGLKL